MGWPIGMGERAAKLGLLTAVAGLIAGCGQVGDLKPAPGQPLPVKPKLARTVPTPEELLSPPTIARPERVDELQSRNRPRSADRFDLPPPDGGEAPAAETNTQTEQRTDDPGPATPQ